MQVTRSKRPLVLAGIGLFVVAGITAAVVITHPPVPKNGPTYATILPSGKSIASLGGWQRVSPDGTNPVYAYADTLDNVAISVSEQPLPDSFTNDGTKLAQLAKTYSATDKVDASGISIFIGNSAKGPQSVIFSKKNLLVLIKSTKVIKNSSWSSYVSSLK